ncbi:MAG: alcohol dehydrogenase catalytic domain-containing protein [Hyphomicrobiales bacterium]|nr:alcohol dehydrogenase catalytic domain-containing protein [Hyphomicrobiales bacterium]
MKALVYLGPEKLAFGDADYPIHKNGDVIIKVNSVGICGSDMHAYLGHDERRPAPLILGHEVAGTVVGGDKDGQRVTINPLVTCGNCPACTSGRDNLCPDRQIISMPPREGGFAEFVAIPASNIVHVPDDFQLEKASLAEPIACGWHAARLAQRAVIKDLSEVRALVIGGGAIGVGVALSLSCFGVSDVTILEPNVGRRQYLLQTTQIPVIDPDDLDDKNQIDLVIDAVGYAQTREVASRAVNPGGVIMHIGLGAAEGGLDIRRMTLQEITFIGTYTYTAADFISTSQAMFQGKLGSLDWIETRPLSEGAKAFADIRQGAVPASKIVLKP